MTRGPFLTISAYDFLADTAAMTLAARGAYVSLMVHACHHDGIIKGDEALLRRIAGASPPVWRQIRKDVLALLEPIEGGYRVPHAVTSAERHRSIVKSARLGGIAKKASKIAQQTLAAGVPNNEPNPLKTNDPVVPMAMPTEGLNHTLTAADGSANLDDWDDPPF